MTLKIAFFEREDVGRVRTHQEDSHGHALGTPNGDVFVMCDGMGGHVGGKQASTLAVSGILEYLQRERFSSAETALLESLEYANRKILTYTSAHPDLKGMGTTACVLLLQGDCAYVAHAGDSRIYLFLGKEKQLHRVTKDHSYVQTLVDFGQITEEEAENHPHKNIIQKALGINQNLNPTIEPMPICPKKGDVFLLCSDGLSGMVQDAVMESVFNSTGSLETKGNMLIDMALTNGGGDNVTAQLVMIEESPHKTTSYRSFNPFDKRSSNTRTIPRRRSCLPKKHIKKVVGSLFLILGIGMIISVCVAGLQWRNYQLTESKLKDKQEELKEINDKLEREGVKINNAKETIGSSKNSNATESTKESEKKSWRSLKDEAQKRQTVLNQEKSDIEKEIANLEDLLKKKEDTFFVDMIRKIIEKNNQ